MLKIHKNFIYFFQVGVYELQKVKYYDRSLQYTHIHEKIHNLTFRHTEKIPLLYSTILTWIMNVFFIIRTRLIHININTM